ncbi:MAG: hypothetical protein ABIT37_06965 [Luteolibacter sp.]
MKTLLCAFLAAISTATLHAEEIVAVAHPGENLSHDKIVVWSPLFQAAWDDLHRGFGMPVKVDPPNALMDRLDHFTWKADTVMPGDHWKVWSGTATKELIDKANTEAARMTGEKKGPFQTEPKPDTRIALGLLDRDLVFMRPLHRSVDAPLVFHSADGTEAKVRFFGARRKASGSYGGVVNVLSYQAGSHALQIASDADDSAVLYLPDKPVSFVEACAKLREWRSKGPEGVYGSAQDPNLHEKDDVRIPVLKLASTTDFAPLLSSSRYFGSAGDPWQIYKAEQRVKFELTEKGAKLRVEVETDMEPFGERPPPPPLTPRFFHYDRPFFVFLWRDGAEWPYFGAWIGNGTPMEVFKEP